MNPSKKRVLQQQRLRGSLLLQLVLFLLAAAALAPAIGTRSPYSTTSAASSNSSPYWTIGTGAPGEGEATATAGAVADAHASEQASDFALAATEAATASGEAALPAAQTGQTVATKKSHDTLLAEGADSNAPNEGSPKQEGKPGATPVPPGAAERQFMNVPPGVIARARPLSAPFVRHYSKHMAILWEWYTKTIGATMNGKRKQDEDVRLLLVLLPVSKREK